MRLRNDEKQFLKSKHNNEAEARISALEFFVSEPSFEERQEEANRIGCILRRTANPIDLLAKKPNFYGS